MPDSEQFQGLLTELESISAHAIDPDVPLKSLDTDSLDLLEWLVFLEQEHGISVTGRLDDLQHLTVRELYDTFILKGDGTGR